MKIWKSCRTFKERSNWYICENNILFPERRSLFEGKINLGADAILVMVEGLQVPFKPKLVSQRKFVDLLQEELIKLEEI